MMMNFYLLLIQLSFVAIGNVAMEDIPISGHSNVEETTGMTEPKLPILVQDKKANVTSHGKNKTVTAMNLTTVKSPAVRRGGGLVAGMMLTEFMPLGGRCDPTTFALASAGLVFGSGVVILDTATCAVKCAFECLGRILDYEKCYDNCEENTCGWIPDGQWARDMLGDDRCGLLPLKNIFDQDKMTTFFGCCKKYLESIDKGTYFHCLCKVQGLSQVVGVDIPCCDGQCGPKCLPDQTDHGCRKCDATTVDEKKEMLKSDCNQDCIKDNRQDECMNLNEYLVRTKEAIGSTEVSPARNAIDGDKKTIFSTSGSLDEGDLHWLQIKMKEEKAIWKVLMRSSGSCCSQPIQIWVGNYKIPDKNNKTESNIQMEKREENTSSNAINITSLLSGNELCGNFTGTGKENEIYLIDCLTKKEYIDISGQYVTIVSKHAMKFTEIELYGSEPIIYTTTELTTTTEETEYEYTDDDHSTDKDVKDTTSESYDEEGEGGAGGGKEDGNSGGNSGNGGSKTIKVESEMTFVLIIILMILFSLRR